MLVEMMSRDSTLPCFSAGAATSLQLRQRFQLHLSDPEVDQFVESVLIQKSYGSMYTRLYDQFQLLTQGIYS
jgi:phosphatidylinositol 4-kinase